MTPPDGALPIDAPPGDGLDVVTFGCRLNAAESEAIRAHATAAGWTDAIIVNSCAVTAEAERQARQTIRRLRRERPNAKIVVTGCAAQIDPGRFAAMPEVDRVIGNAEKLQPKSYLALEPARIEVGDASAIAETASHLATGFEGRARAFLEVQQGCDHRCTFCIIPYGRGASRSLPLGPVADKLRSLVESGIQEVVLTGVDLTAYGADLPGKPSLGAMVRRLLALVPELPRLRLSSLDPAEFDDELFDLVANEPRLMPHLHLSVQAGDDLILKRMARRHLRADVTRLAARLRAVRPDLALGADLIAGFPTESEEAFERGLALIDEAGLTHLHVFPFSARPGTPAARMPHLSGPVVRERAARLRAKGAEAMAAYLASRIGARAQVLVEKPGFGRCERYLPVRLADNAGVAGAVVTARMTRVVGAELVGEVAA